VVAGKPLKLDLYVPQGAIKPLPVIIWIHGGGWVGGKRIAPWTQPVDKWILPITQSGFALATIDYRLSFQAKFPAQIEDCKAAIRWVRAHAADYNLDPNRIGAAGSSAGGHLVALLGTTPDDPALEGDEGNKGVSSRLKAVCDFFGPTDFLTIRSQEEPDKEKKKYAVDDAITKLLGSPVEQNLDEARLASPVYHISAQTCPFFIAHGDLDLTVPLQQSVEFNDALQKAGIPSTLYVVKGGHHGVRDPVAFQMAINFFKKYL
jgi:acetyl esterase/lipase